jgi:DNA-binding transcriptional LysR family regulator
MIESITFDQLRVLVEVVEQGSFSAAARKLHRVQSAVSYAISNLEEQLGLELFDRSTRRPQLTKAGKAIVQEARGVLGQVHQLSERARAIRGGVEPEVSLVVTALFPMPLLIEACRRFYERYETVGLRVYCESLGMVSQHVLDENCHFGISGPDTLSLPALDFRPCGEIPMVTVISASHPLARLDRAVTQAELSKVVQIVITDRSRLTEGIDKGVLSEHNWRVADLETKHELLKAGLGWGGMPLERVYEDLQSGVLAELKLDFLDEKVFQMPLYMLTTRSNAPGPAGRWMMKTLESLLRGLSKACKREESEAFQHQTTREKFSSLPLELL